MIKVSRLVLAALFLLLFSGMSFGQEMGAGESGPGTGVIGGSSASMIVDPSIFGSSSSTGGTDWSKCSETISIGSADALKKFASRVNGGETSLCGKLTADIELNGGASNQWIPIGTETIQFEGTFDGQGHTISGLYVDVEMNYVGLFGNVANGVVKNVGVMDSHIKGWAYVGGVVGNNVSGSVSNVYNTGFVNGEWDVGGVVGYNGGIVSNVYNTGAVSGNGEGAGGVVGGNDGTVSNAYYNTDFYAGNAVGGGDASGENVEGKTTLELASKTLPDGFDENVWVAGSISIGDDGSVTFGLPYLNGQSSQLTFKLEMDVNKYLEISTALQLKLFAQLVNSGETSINGKLTADICLNACKEGDKPLLEQIAGLGENGDISTLGFNQWTPIGTDKNGYLGTFDGNGHTIRGLYFNDERTNYVGLFGYISGSTAKVQNVGVVDSYFKGYWYVGGVVGQNDGTVSTVYNTGSVSGNYEVGGVVGYNEGTVSNVYNTGIVSGNGSVGGVVGYNEGTVSNVYNTGSVSGDPEVGGVVGYNDGTVSNVYNTGSVSGIYYVGGVVGYNDGTVRNGFFNEEYYPGNAIGGGGGTANTVVGKTSTELANLTVGNGGDFPLLEGETESPWAKGIYYDKATGKLANSELPYLKSLPKPQDVEMEFNVKDNVIQISSAEDLKNFARLVNEFGITDANAELTTSITLNSNLLGENNANVDAETGEYKGTAPAIVWTPIGYYDYDKNNRYDGVFNGNGNTVSGLYFNNESAECVGLFGAIGEYSKVQNVGVVDSYLRGKANVGGVVGCNYGGFVGNVYSTGFVRGSEYVGGVVGYSYVGFVGNVYSTGFVSGSESVGGVVGYIFDGGVENAYYNKDVFNGNAIGDALAFDWDEGGFGEQKDFEVPENVKGATSAEFTDGTVAMLLHDWCEMDGETCKEGGLNGSIWGQDLAAENSLPDFSGVVGFKYGSITFFNLIDGVADSASIDATAKAPVSITSDIVVTGPITFKRPFAVGYSTMMLPFGVSAENKPAELEFYSFDKVEEINGKYTASYNPVNAGSGLNAHKPYIVKNSGKSALSQVTFEGEFTLKTVFPASSSSSNGWEFKGTYEYKSWEEGDEGLGRTYGFAANDGVNDESIVGQFAKVGAGAYIYPMRAYLEYSAPAKLGRPAANGVAAKAVVGNANTVAALPDEIDVVIVEKDETTGEQTTRVIGAINTRTGEFKFANDRWFDLQGRYLGNKKPSQKGAYYNNGKKVIVK